MRGIIGKLKRRNVFRVGIVYAAVGWVLVQVTAVGVPAFAMPLWVNTLVLYLTIIGFPMALIFAWASEPAKSAGRSSGDADDDASAFHSTDGESNDGDRPRPAAGEASDEGPVYPPLPSEPSIAVLPFENLSGDIEQEYFADGIVEDIISTLGRFRWFFVIARNSSFAYKGSATDVRQVARELGVRYVLEGSVRKVGQQVRVTTELSDASTAQHIWAGHFDCELDDVFAMQDEISEAVIASVAPQFLSAEAKRAKRKDTKNLDAWDYCMRGRSHLWKFNKEDSVEAQRLLQKAVDLDPEFAAALAYLGSLHVIDALFGWSDSLSQSLAKAHLVADKAVHLDEQDAWAQAVVGLVDAFSKRFEDSIHRLERAVKINPSLSAAHGFLAWTETMVGNTERAVKEAEIAIRLSPRDPIIVLWHAALSGAAFVASDYEKAVHWARVTIEDRKDWPSGHRLLAASLGQMGDVEGAHAAVRDLLHLNPGLTQSNLRNQIPYRDTEVVERFRAGLNRGGLPD